MSKSAAWEIVPDGSASRRDNLAEPWLGVEPRHLATFVAVAEAGSFREAAVELGYAQSAVSQQIAQLERALKTPLIERKGRNGGPLLTPAGDMLLDHARRVVDYVRAASADLACLAGGGTIRIGVEPATVGLTATLVARLVAHRPELRLSLSELSAARQLEQIVAGALDLGVGHFPSIQPGLARRPAHADEWVLAVPASWTIEPASLESLTALRGLRLIEDRSHPVPLDASRLGLDIIASCNRAIALDLARAGVGAAILPGLAVDQSEPALRRVVLGRLLPPRTVSIVWQKARRVPGGVAVHELAALVESDSHHADALEGVA